MGKFDELAAQRPKIGTRRELDALRADRAAPDAHPHPQPEGLEMAALSSGAAEADERRITLLETKFRVLRERTATEHRLTALRGTARRDFGQER